MRWVSALHRPTRDHPERSRLMNAIIGEEWKAVPGWEGCYEVSDQGRVRSLDRWTVNQRRRFFPGKLLIPLNGTNGYKHVCLYSAPRHKQVEIHRLVMLTFVGPCPDGMEVAHGDRNKHNNRLSNLRYDTRAGNLADTRIHGTHREGETCVRSKLTAAEVTEIYSFKGLISATPVASAYDCTAGNIYAIWKGKSWRSVTGAPRWR
jgi:hypothetical protein